MGTARAADRGPACTPLLDSAANGERAIKALGTNLARVADERRVPAAVLRSRLRTDASMWVDRCGALFYVDPAAKTEVDPAADSTTSAAAFPTERTFALHSKPGSQRVLYLDFDGHVLVNTAWNAWSALGLGSSHTLVPYDADNAPATFSDTERAVVQSVWRRVAEDYAPFDVDVTTQEPPADAITRSSQTDVTYGTRVVVTNDRKIYDYCICGGLAYLDAFDHPDKHSYYQPALVFTAGVSSVKGMGEAAAHEAGHNLGLSHDGTATQAYYGGHETWGPIMGVGYSRPVTQWSRGEYAGANNTEDDLQVIASHGARVRPDDHANVRGPAATALQPSLGTSAAGLVGAETVSPEGLRTQDTDVFSFAGAGPTQIAVTPAAVSPNLDVVARLLDAAGNVVQSSDPGVTFVNRDRADGMAAAVSTTLDKGTYYLEVQGAAFGDPLLTGYSRYGSVGSYIVSLQTGVVEITAAALPTAFVGEHFSATLEASGGTGSYDWEVVNGVLPSGLSLSRGGTVSGTPLAEADTTVTVRATDVIGRSATAVVAVKAVIPPPDSPVVSVQRGDRAFLVTAPQVSPTRPQSGIRVALDGEPVADSASDRVRLGGLTAGHEYEVEVIAYGPGGEAPAAVRRALAITTPARPEWLTAVSGARVGAGAVQLRWKASPSTVAQPLTGYRIYRDGVRLTSTSATSLRIKGLTNGRQYTFRVRPYGPAGQGLGRGAVATPVRAPSAVKTVTMARRKIGVRLTWSAVASTAAAPVTGYRVYRGTKRVYQGTTRAVTVRTVGYSRQAIKVVAYGRGGQSPPYKISAWEIRTLRAQ